VEHPAADLTITVGGGTTLAVLERTLGSKGQFWPCDAPFAAAATVGGTIASNANGALRMRYGPVRELVLGARIATADGTLVRTGSRVVKSVAGYDGHKLMAGSFGTLGLIVEATLRAAPLPETESIAIGRFKSHVTACAVGRTAAASHLFPMAIVLLDDRAARRVGALLPHAASGAWLLLVRCGGNKQSVARQVADLTATFDAAGADATGALDAAATTRAWVDVRETSGGAAYAPDEFAIVKIASLPTETSAVIAEARSRWPASEICAHPATGIAFANIPMGDLAVARTSAPVASRGAAADSFARACVRAGWSASTTPAPGGFDGLPSFVASAQSPVRLFRSVKAALDPAGTLDPGRMPGGV